MTFATATNELASATAWARSSPAGLARISSFGRWLPARHLMLLQEKLMDVAARRTKRLMVFMPPRHGKSTMTSLYFPTWYLGTFPKQKVILASYEAGYAATWGQACRDLMEEFGPALWGVRVRPDRRSSADWSLVSTRGDNTVRFASGGMRTAGIGSGVTGRGAHLILIDDPVKDDLQANSATYRQRAWDWFQATLSTRQESEPNTVFVLIMTRWHEDDLAGRLIEHGIKEGRPWEVLSLPAVAEDDDDPLGRVTGEALWPEYWPRSRLNEMKSGMSAYWWASLYQQRPAPAEGGIFKRRWWRFWQPAGVHMPPPVVVLPDEPDHIATVRDLPAKFDEVVSSWDLTFSGGEGSWIVGQKWGRRGADTYLLDQIRRQMDYPTAKRTFKEWHRRHADVGRKYIEYAANAAALIADLHGEVPGLVKVPVQGDKQHRARSVSAYVESGNVYLPHPAMFPWVDELVEELSAFPNARNDDQVDTMSQALRKFHGGSASTDPRDYGALRR
jgi:predicted phage terminase large subunit-like protein